MSSKLLLIVICSLACSLTLWAQSLEVFDISIDGNDKTKERTILRELDFSIGDSIQQETLSTRLDRNRNNLLKTGLFTEVSLNINDWSTGQRRISVAITVSESWYIFPVPLFELADRNFNVWWTEQNRSLSRVNLGMRVYLLNLNGINDQLKVKMQVGYTPKLEVTYQIPFINRKQTVGLEFNVLRSVNKEIALLNQGNKQVFFEQNDEIIFRRTRVRLGTSYRPNLYTDHRFLIEYHNHRVAPSLAQEHNPDFFLNSRDQQQLISLEYAMTFDKRDRATLPTTGWYAGIELIKQGVGVFGDLSTTVVKPFVHRHISISDNTSIGWEVHAKWSLERGKVPFYNYRGLGFLDDYLRGYELYVVEGLDYGYLRTSVRIKIAESTFNWKRKMPIKSFRLMPWQFYLSFNYDAGYVNDPFYNESNSFTNRWLHGGGIGLNFLLYNIFVFQVEFSANHLGEKGLFLHTKTSF